MFALKAAVKMPRCVQVEWEDGLLARFNYLWLQDNSVRRPSLVHLDLNTKPEAIKCSKDTLNLVWPPYTASDYSSDFLRENALTVAEQEKQSALSAQNPSTSTSFNNVHLNLAALQKQARYVPVIHVGSDERVSADAYASLEHGQIMSGASTNGDEIWAIVDAHTADSRFVMGQSFWGAAAREPGTVWPHLQRVPTICAVDTLCGDVGVAPAEISVVDTFRALSTLAARYPAEFEFLAQHVLEYSEGMFRARHSACSLVDGQVVPGVFNNAARSTTFIAEPLDRLYESLQKFGRICAESTRIVHLPAGKRLLIDNSKAMLGAPTQSGRQLMLRCLS